MSDPKRARKKGVRFSEGLAKVLQIAKRLGYNASLIFRSYNHARLRSEVGRLVTIYNLAIKIDRF